MDANQIVAYLNEQDQDKLADLYAQADAVRKQYMGDAVHLRGIIEFSNYCLQDCLYCGLRRSNSNVKHYRMEIEEIIETAKKAVTLGITTVVLQGGEDSYYSVDDICYVLEHIKKMDLAITLSMGERSFEDYKKFKDAGADRYLLRFETSDEELYQKIRPGRKFETRLQCLKDLKELGYQVGSGIMVGIPGQTYEGVAKDILLFDELDLDMIGVGPFLPHPDTPLAENEATGLEMVLKVVAITRIVTKNAHIPATTAVGTIDPEGRQRALRAGANIIMPNLTSTKYREFYEIYPDKICIDEDATKCRACVERMITAQGRTIGDGYGHSLKTKA